MSTFSGKAATTKPDPMDIKNVTAGAIVQRITLFTPRVPKEVDFVVHRVRPNGDIELAGVSGTWMKKYFKIIKPGPPPTPVDYSKYAPGQLLSVSGHPSRNGYGAYAKVYGASGCCGLAELFGVSYLDPEPFFTALAWADHIFYPIDKTRDGLFHVSSPDAGACYAHYVMTWHQSYERADLFKKYIEENKLGITSEITPAALNRNSGNELIAMLFTPDRKVFLSFLWNLRVCTSQTPAAAA